VSPRLIGRCRFCNIHYVESVGHKCLVHLDPTPPSVASDADRERRAKEFTKSKDDDCLCQRTQPGTRYGEHIYIFCGCSLHEAFIAGAESEAAHRDAYWEERCRGLVEAAQRCTDRGYPCSHCDLGYDEECCSCFDSIADSRENVAGLKEALAAFRAGGKGEQP